MRTAEEMDPNDYLSSQETSRSEVQTPTFVIKILPEENQLISAINPSKRWLQDIKLGHHWHRR
jgi:hypothetical protein